MSGRPMERSSKRPRNYAVLEETPELDEVRGKGQVACTLRMYGAIAVGQR